LRRNEKVEQHIRNKTHKLNVLRFWVEGDVISLCKFGSILIIVRYPLLPRITQQIYWKNIIKNYFCNFFLNLSIFMQFQKIAPPKNVLWPYITIDFSQVTLDINHSLYIIHRYKNYLRKVIYIIVIYEKKSEQVEFKLNLWTQWNLNFSILKWI